MCRTSFCNGWNQLRPISVDFNNLPGRVEPIGAQQCFIDAENVVAIRIDPRLRSQRLFVRRLLPKVHFRKGDLMQAQVMRRLVTAVSVSVWVIGCGAAEMQVPPLSGPAVVSMPRKPGDVFSFKAASSTESATEQDSTALVVAKAISHRRIVYNTQLKIRVESFDGVSEHVIELTEQSGGFVASAATNGTSGEQRSGFWTVRIPVAQYRAFLTAAGELGEITSQTESTTEVTAEFYDVEARIRNKLTEEQRLIQLLESSQEQLENILTVEREITRVRGEVEQLQGRMRLLRDQTELSTVRLEISEVENYVPEEAPSFGTQVVRQWRSTRDGLVGMSQTAILTVIRVGPWFVLLAVVAVPLSLFLRRRIQGILAARSP